MALAIPSHMTISTALAVSMVVITVATCLTVTLTLYCRLTPAQRRDVIRLTAAVMRIRQDDGES